MGSGDNMDWKSAIGYIIGIVGSTAAVLTPIYLKLRADRRAGEKEDRQDAIKGLSDLLDVQRGEIDRSNATAKEAIDRANEVMGKHSQCEAALAAVTERANNLTRENAEFRDRLEIIEDFFAANNIPMPRKPKPKTETMPALPPATPPKEEGK